MKQEHEGKRNALVKKSLASQASVAFLSKLSNIIGTPIWLTGSTLLALLTDKRYAGDLDILVPIDAKQLKFALNQLGMIYSNTFNGAIRVNLNDGSQIDFVSRASFQRETEIISHLERFDFSCVSRAMRLDDLKILETESARNDLLSGRFRINQNYVRNEQNAFSIIKRYSSFTNFYRLICDDEQTIAYIIYLNQVLEKANLVGSGDTVLQVTALEVQKLLGGDVNFLVCRGLVRNSYLGRASCFDDWDIIVDLSTSEVLNRLAANGVHFMLNYFRMPKVRSLNGQKIDFICSNGRAPMEILDSFVHNCDRVAWDPRQRTFVCPSNELSEISNNTLNLRDATFENGINNENFYYLQKSVFYEKLYRFNVPEGLKLLFHQDFLPLQNHLSCGCRLSIELLCRSIVPNLARKHSDIDDQPPKSAIGTMNFFF